MKTKQYINLHIKSNCENMDIISGELSKFSIKGVEERDGELIVCFDISDWAEIVEKDLLKRLKRIDPDVDVSKIDLIDEKNWNEEYEKKTPAIKISDKVGIAPEWKIKELDCPIRITVNPKMAFGTGAHSSTKLLCRLMERYVKEGEFWIDAGSGTGILAILAIKLGADRVYAFDNNEWAIENSIENARINAAENQITIESAEIEDASLPPADGIAANLFTSLIVSSMPKFYESLAKSKGKLLVSGILRSDEYEVKTAASKNGLEELEQINEDEWTAIGFKVKDTK